VRARSATPDEASPRPVFAQASGATVSQTATRAAAIAEGLRQRGLAGPRKSRPARELRRAVPVDDSFVRDAERSLERRIRAHLSRGAVTVTLTDNRYTMISVRREAASGPRYDVRLHHMFADADPIIARALASYIGRNCADASRLLGDFIDAHQDRVRPTNRRAAGHTIVTDGEVHDLQEIFDDINDCYFGGAIEALITWGPRCGKPRRRNSIKMGSYSVEDKLIRIHRSLDRSFVPRFFVAWIIYHEMLHQVHGAPIVNGRRQFHTRAFLEEEARFECYAAARAWERQHLDQLLTY
jgi:hypothetical protein